MATCRLRACRSGYAGEPALPSGVFCMFTLNMPRLSPSSILTCTGRPSGRESPLGEAAGIAV